MSKLLREFVSLEYDQKLVKESREQGRPIMLSGIFQRANCKNENGRIYPKHILEREISNYQKEVEGNRALGTCDHEDSGTINLSNVSHVVRKLYWDGPDIVRGTLEVLSTPKGKILASLVEAGISLGVSSRAIGEVSKNADGVDVVSEDLILISFDCVQNPSTPGAWMTLGESKEIKNPFSCLSKSARINRILSEILK